MDLLGGLLELYFENNPSLPLLPVPPLPLLSLLLLHMGDDDDERNWIPLVE